MQCASGSFIIIINYCIISINAYIINSQYNYHMIFLIKASTKNAISNKIWQKLWLLLLLPIQKQTAKHSVQCHVFVQSPPDQRPKHKYPVTTSHRSDLCKSVSLQFYLVATLIHIQSVRSQICVCVHMLCTM
jgi:hypothetical protein